MVEGRRYMVVIRLSDTSTARLAPLVHGLTTVLEWVASDKPELALRSVTADVFAYFIRTKANARQIVAAIESPGRQSFEKPNKPNVDPFLSGEDSVLVFEIGDDFLAGRGFTRVGNWLQHH